VVLGISEERIEALLSDAVRDVAEILRRPEVVPPTVSRPRQRRAPARKAART
jgi:hypothetical protein